MPRPAGRCGSAISPSTASRRDASSRRGRNGTTSRRSRRWASLPGGARAEPSLHEFLDDDDGPGGDAELARRLEAGEDLTARAGRRGRDAASRGDAAPASPSAVRRLLDHGADIDARTAGGKTAYAHAERRGFSELASLLAERGADTTLAPADRLAVAVVGGEARRGAAPAGSAPRLRAHRQSGGGPPARRRGRAEPAPAPVALLIAAGADLTATGLDEGTPLHQAAWFGQPDNARLLLEAGAPLDVFDAVPRQLAARVGGPRRALLRRRAGPGRCLRRGRPLAARRGGRPALPWTGRTTTRT